jgi:hypothetical protein
MVHLVSSNVSFSTNDVNSIIEFLIEVPSYTKELSALFFSYIFSMIVLPSLDACRKYNTNCTCSISASSGATLFLHLLYCRHYYLFPLHANKLCIIQNKLCIMQNKLCRFFLSFSVWNNGIYINNLCLGFIIVSFSFARSLVSICKKTFK